MVNIVSKLKEFAEDNEYIFIFGSLEYQNAEVNMKSYGYEEIIMTVDLEEEVYNFPNTFAPTDGDNTYNYFIMFGRKFESEAAGTKASLDETMIQKHDRRLSELRTLGMSKIKDFACSNNLGLQRIKLEYLPNMFGNEIDYVQFDTTFIEK